MSDVVGQPDKGTTGETTGRGRPAGVILIHILAAAIVIICAYAGRLPFLWLVDTHSHRPSWVGFTLVWVLGTAAYFLVWQQIGQYNRVAEVLVTILLMVNAVWAAFTVLVSVLQVTGIGVRSLLTGTLPWFLRLLVAVLTLLAVLVYVRLGRATDEGAEGEPLRHATPPPSFLVVSLAGFLVGAWALALLAPPQASSTEARRAVASVARHDVKTSDVVAFQSSVDDVVEKESALHPRDRWETVRGFFSKDGKITYDNSIQWGVLVAYRDEMTCVARNVSTHAVVVRAGFCPG